MSKNRENTFHRISRSSSSTSYKNTVQSERDTREVIQIKWFFINISKK